MYNNIIVVSYVRKSKRKDYKYPENNSYSPPAYTYANNSSPTPEVPFYQEQSYYK